MISGEFPPLQGGVGDYTNLLCRQLTVLGVQVGVVTSKAAGEGAHGQGFPVAPAVERWNLFCWPELGKRIRTMNANIVHVQYQTAQYGLHPAINLLPLALRLAKNPAKVVFTFHDLQPPRQAWLRGPARGLAMRAGQHFCDGFIATNGADFQRLLAERPGPSEARYHLVPIGPNVLNQPPPRYTREEMRRRLGMGSRTLLLAHFGLLNASKGLPDLLAAMSLLAQQRREVRLLLVGGSTGSSDRANVSFAHDVHQQIDELGLRPLIVETGFLAPAEVSAHLLAADVCVLPYRDGASFRRGTLMAALEHGLPIVTTAPAEAALVDGVNVRLAVAGNPEALAQAIASLADDTVLRKRLGHQAARLAKQFSWQSIAEKNMNLYLELLEEPVGHS
ncbi:MAG TPA: glycosyltransferase family 4 protein [Chloroflexota bacterium]|nr:glycosyltransferase family 4 protein [Chloroflexota bacterium]